MDAEHRAHEHVAHDWIDAWNAHDVDRVMALHADGATHRMSAGPVRAGPDLRAMVERSLMAYPDLSFSLRDAFGVARGDGARLVIEYTMRGTQTGAINGRPASGRPIEVDGALVVTLDAQGRIVEAVDHIDHHAIRAQQGLA